MIITLSRMPFLPPAHEFASYFVVNIIVADDGRSQDGVGFEFNGCVYKLFHGYRRSKIVTSMPNR